MATADRKKEYYTAVREANRAVWNGINTLVALQREWNAEDYGNTLGNGTGPHEGITSTQVGAVVFDSADAFVTVLATGVATNMANLL